MAQLIYTNAQFIFQCTFAERAIPKEAGFRWDNQRKLWFTPDDAAAVRLREYGTETTKQRLDRLFLKYSPWSAPLPAPPDGLELLPHQRDAIRFALERNRSYLGLDPGLGKTIVAAMIAKALSLRPVVYITPPHLVRNVEAEFSKWAPEIDLTVVPDSMLTKAFVSDWLVGEEEAILFVDEAHRFKNEEAKRTKALFGEKTKAGDIPGIVDRFTKQVYLSGTPMPNRPIELYPILSKAAPQTINFASRFKYGKAFCGAYHNGHGWDFTGATNMPELASRVIAPSGPFMLRMKKELLNLPPKLEEVFVLSDTMSPRLAQMNSKLAHGYKDGEDVIKALLAKSVGKNEDELPLMTYRRLLGQEKVAPAVEYIETLLEETDENILVFAYHTDVIDGLMKELRDHAPFVITGSTPMHVRQDQVSAFQAGRDRLFIGNYQAMGTGFTLTRATRVIFVEFDWVPGTNQQAADRAHRISQKSPVLVQYMVYADSLDKKVIDTLLRKQKAISYV